MLGNAFTIYNENRTERLTANTESFSEGLIGAWMSVYLIGLGEFGDLEYEGNNVKAIWITFIATTFLAQLMVFNMLVNIMGYTLDRVIEQQEELGLNG